MLSRAPPSASRKHRRKIGQIAQFLGPRRGHGYACRKSNGGSQVAKKGSGPFDAFVAQQKLTPEQKEFLRRGLKSRPVRAFFDATADQTSYTRQPGAPG